MNPLDTITICKVGHGKTATKTHELVSGDWITTSFDAGYRVQSRPARLDGLGALYRLLAVLADKPEYFILRGALLVPGGIPHVRRYHPLEPTDEDPNPDPPSYMATDRRWLCLDVDDWLVPDELRAPERRAELVRTVINGLPDWFHRAGVVVQWSSSAGLDGFRLAKLHLWFWLSRPICGFSIREEFHKWNDTINKDEPDGKTRIDCALYNPVQPHYTAAPLFSPAGIVDPLCRFIDGDIPVSDRLVLFMGPPADPPARFLDLAGYDGKELDQRAQEKARRLRARQSRAALGTRWSNASRKQRYVDAALSAAVRNVEEVHGTLDWYITLRKESFSTFGLVAAGELEQDVWRTTWEEIAAFPGGIPGRKMTLKDIKRLLDGAERRAGARDVSHVGDDTRGQVQMGRKRTAGGFKARAENWLK